jgi:hypothetical protein
MPKKDHSSAPVPLRGKVRAFNVSPKGHIEGALFDTRDGPVQVNFPKSEAERLAGAMSVGATVDLRGALQTDEFEHPVYLVEDGVEDTHVSGTIVRLNHALHGETNGCHLDDGTFVHLKPEGARKSRLRVGERIKVFGARRSGPAAVVLEARSVERVGSGHGNRAS